MSETEIISIDSTEMMKEAFNNLIEVIGMGNITTTGTTEDSHIILQYNGSLSSNWFMYQPITLIDTLPDNLDDFYL